MNKVFTRVLALAFISVFIIAFNTTTGYAAKGDGCGAIGEKPCPLSKKANLLGKAQTSCPKGSFLDVKTSACWSCRKDYVRSVESIHSKNACRKKPKTSYQKADKKRKVKVGKKGCKKSEFWDKKGGKLGACWKCPNGYSRGVAKVDGNKACVKVTGLTSAKATKVGNFKPCKKGFFDPRAKGQCWSCPKDYNRSVTKVTAKGACVIKLVNVCDKGNILVYSKCQKKNLCGKLGQRPCLVVERVPSCKKGLLEDPTQNKCVNAASLVCSIIMDTLKTAQKGAKRASKQQQKIEKQVSKTFDAGVKAMLGKKAYKTMTSGLKKSKKLIDKTSKKAAKIVKKTLEKQMEKILPGADQILEYANALGKNKDKMLKATMSKKFCLSSPKDKMNILTSAMGIKFKPFKKASLEPGWYDGLLVKSAHAAKGGKGAGSGSFAIGISLTSTDIPAPLKKFLEKQKNEGSPSNESSGGINDLGVGVSVSYYLVTSNGKTAQRIGLGGVATTSKAVFSISPFFQVLKFNALQDVGGWGWSLGFGGDVEGMMNQGQKATRTGVKGDVVKAELGASLLLTNSFEYAGIEIASAIKFLGKKDKKSGKGTKTSFAFDIGYGYDFTLK